VKSYIALFAASLMCSLSGPVQAGPNTYMCKILQAVELSDSGHFVEHTGIWRWTIGESFTVNRNTGEMIGLPFSTEDWLGGVNVIDRGGDGNSYKALVISGGPNIAVKYIYVTEFQEGMVKSFWGSGDNAVIFSGTCI
jgi:hypothetical protein